MAGEATMIKVVEAGQEHGGGLQLGIATDKVGFFGTAPIVQRAAPNAAVVLGSAQNATAAAVDLGTSEALANALKANYNALQTDVAAVNALLSQLRANDVALGLIAGP